MHSGEGETRQQLAADRTLPKQVNALTGRKKPQIGRPEERLKSAENNHEPVAAGRALRMQEKALPGPEEPHTSQLRAQASLATDRMTGVCALVT